MAVDSNPGASLRTAHAEQEVTAALGQVFDGRYRITALIGDGGMGSVYRAEHLGIDRPVALKLLHRSIASQPGFAARFEREAMVAGKTDHENCVGVDDFGRLEDGTHYLVMELVDGTSLYDTIDAEGDLGVRRSLHIARHILEGLSHLHHEGIIHRDVKPDNIILTEHNGDRDFAKILDFGIAKLIGDAALEIENNQLTQIGTTVGTPKYIAPEQAFGKKVDGRADLYSLSVLLYQMVTGHPPFDAEEVLDLLMMHASKQPPPLSHFAPHLAIPAALEALIQHGLAKKPDQRIASAEEYLRRINAIAHALDQPTPKAAYVVSMAAPPHSESKTSPSLSPTLLIERARAWWFRVRWFVHQETHQWSHTQVAAAAAVGVVGIVLLLASILGGGSTGALSTQPRAESDSIQIATSPLFSSPVAARAQALNDEGKHSEVVRLLRDHEIESDGRAALELAHALSHTKRRLDAVKMYETAFKQTPVLRANSKALATLEGWLPSRDHRLRFETARVLAQFAGDDAAKEIIVDLASSEKKRTLRQQAREAADDLGIESRVDQPLSYILDLKQETDCSTRKAIVEKLVSLGDSRAIPAIEKAAKTKRGRFGGAADDCLAEVANQAISDLEEE